MNGALAHRLLILGVLAGLAAPGSAAAQEIIPDAETCPECTLEFREVRRLGDQPGQELYADIHRWLVEDDSGRTWVPNVGQGSGHVIQVYDEDGRYVDFERRGDGPGEFRMVNMLVCTSRGILLFDRSTVNLIDPQAWTSTFVLRDDEIGYHQRAMNGLEVADGHIWLASPLRHPDYLGFPIVTLDLEEGRYGPAFGKEVEHYDRAVERHLSRYLVALDGQRVATVGEWAYEVRIRALNGRALRHFVRDAPWFRPVGENDPMVLVSAVKALDPHTLAVFILERDPEAPPAVEEGDRRSTDEEWNAIVEVLDLRQGRVLKRLRMPEPVVATVCPTGRVVTSALAPGLGIDHLRLYEVLWERRP